MAVWFKIIEEEEEDQERNDCGLGLLCVDFLGGEKGVRGGRAYEW